MKLLVTGAYGMLGQDICKTFENLGWIVTATDYDSLDITNEKMTNSVIEDVYPDVVVHCAAFTDVDKIEDAPETAININVYGTKNVAKATQAVNAAMVYISTDYVFDGEKTTPYLTTDKPNPINMYGKTKYHGELMTIQNCQKFYIARTSWLYGLHGKNFVETMLSLKDKELIQVVDDQIGCPTWTMELVMGISKLFNQPYGIYHICGSGSCSWYEFAKEIFKQSGLEVNLKPCTTEEFPRKATRPKYSVMENGGLTRPWQEALSDYLKLRGKA